MRIKLIFPLMLVLLFPLNVVFPMENKPDFILTGPSYWQHMFDKSVEIATAPLYWSGTEWSKAIMVIGATAVAYTQDQNVKEYAQKNRSRSSDNLSSVTDIIDNPLIVLPVTGLVYTYAYSIKDTRLQKVSLDCIESVLIANGFVLAGKVALQRHRPFTGDSPYKFDGPGLSFKDSNKSFPSSHTATAFAVAEVVASEYKDNPGLSYVMYSLALLTAWGRINDNQHWLSDTIVGAALGHYIAAAVISDRAGLWDQCTLHPVWIYSTIGLQGSLSF